MSGAYKNKNTVTVKSLGCWIAPMQAVSMVSTKKKSEFNPDFFFVFIFTSINEEQRSIE